MVRDLLGLGEDAVASVARLRTLLASDIHLLRPRHNVGDNGDTA